MEKNSDVAFIFKRSFLGFFWGVIFMPLFIAYFWIKSLSPEESAAYNIGVENPYLMGGIFFYVIVIAVYAFITAHIKSTERVIRLMSDKDGNKMMPAQSLMVSKKIFKNSIKFEFIQFMKYYSLMVVIYVVAFGNVLRVFFNFLDETATLSETGTAFAIGGVVILVGYIYTHYFLAAKTRFLWFIYMSHFGEGFSSSAIFDEVKKLNSVDKGDDKVAMFGYLKRDMAADISSFTTSSTIDAVAPKGLGSDIAKGYARGMAIDAVEYSKMKLNYAQFKDAYSKVYGKNPELSPQLFK